MTYPELLLEKAKWNAPMEELTEEVVKMIQKFADVIDEDVSMRKRSEA